MRRHRPARRDTVAPARLAHVSLLALLLSLVLEHFRPVLRRESVDAALPEAHESGAAPAQTQIDEGAPDAGSGRRVTRGAGRRDDGPGPMEPADAGTTRTTAGGATADDDLDDLDEVLARMADETPEPDPFAELPAESALPPDPDLVQRARMQDDRDAFVPMSHPWFAPASRLVDWATPEAIDTVDRPPMGWGGWSVVVAVPAATVLVVQWLLSGLGWPGVLAILGLHVWVLWHGVLAGRLKRRIDRLFVLAGTLDDDVDAATRCAALVRRWVSPRGRVPPHPPDARETARLALSLPLLDAYRDVFAPLFWYLLLPGACGPVVAWCARVAAMRRGGVAASGLRLLDWVPIRLAAFGFALGGRFDDAVFGLRSSHAASGSNAVLAQPLFDASSDPAADQRLMLLPAASGALGIDLLDEASRQRLKAAASDVAADTAAPVLAQVAAVRALMLRCAGAWAVVMLVGWWIG